MQTTELTTNRVTSTPAVVEFASATTLSALPPIPFPVSGNSSTTAVITPLPSTILGSAGFFTAPRQSSAPAPTESLLETLLVDKSFTPTTILKAKTTHFGSSHAPTNTNYTAGATTIPAAAEARSGGSSTNVIVIVVAIGGIITVLVSVSVIFMYCIRSRTLRRASVLGGPQPMSFRDKFRRGPSPNRAMAMASRTSIGSFFGRKPAQGGESKETGRPVTGVSVHESSELPPPTPPIPIPERPPKPNRPERTPSTFIHGISTWEVQSQDHALLVPSELPVTRSPSIHTPTSRSDEVGSPESLGDGAPLPEPPARPKHFPPHPITDHPYPLLAAGNRRSVPTPLNINQLNAFYRVPGGDLSSITYTTAPESPAIHVPSPLSPPPPMRLSTQSWHNAQEENLRGPTRLERLTSLYTGGIGYLRGSQAASSHYNSVLGGPYSVHRPPSAYNYYKHSRGLSGLGSPPGSAVDPLDPDDSIKKSIYSLDVYRNTYGTYSSSMTDLPRTATSSNWVNSTAFTESSAIGVGGGREAALALLGGNLPFTPAARQSSVRGSGLVNCSKPSLVSLSDSRHDSEDNAEIAVGDSLEEECEDRPSIVVSRAGNYRSFSTPVQAVSDRISKISTASSKAGGLTAETSEMRTSAAESVSSCTTTGSSILYSSGKGSNPCLHEEMKQEPCREDTLQHPWPLPTLLDNNSSETFGSPSVSPRTGAGQGLTTLTAGGFTFPSPWARGLQSPKTTLAQPTPVSRTITPSESRHVSTSSLTSPDRNNTICLPRSQTFPLFVDTPPSSLAEQDAEEPSSGVSEYVHVPTMDALIQQLKKEKKSCTCSYSASSIYSTSIRSKSVRSGKSAKSVKSRKSARSEKAEEDEAPLGHSSTSSHSSDYIPPATARESVTAYLTASNMSSATPAASTPGTTVTDLTLSSEASPLVDPNDNMQHTTQHPFIFPFQNPPPITPTARYSLPQPQVSFILPRSPTPTQSRLPSPYSSPRLAYTPSPFSPRRIATTDIPTPRPITRGKHRHYRSNSFSGTVRSVAIGARVGGTAQPPYPATEKPLAGGYRVGSKVMSMMVFPRFSTLFGTGKSESEKSQPQSPRQTDESVIHAMV